MNRRLQQLSSWLKQNDISLSFITSTPNIFYLSKFYSNPHERLLALVIFPNEEPILVCPKMEVLQAKQAGWEYEIIGYSDVDNPWELIAKSVQKLGISVERIAIEKEHINVERYEQIQKYFPNASFLSTEEKLRTLRMIKDEHEITILRQAAELADFGVEVGVKALSEGKTELEIIAEIEYELKKKGVRGMSFGTMVLTGEKTAAPHGVPGLTAVKTGDFVLFDLGVVLDGYCSDITRTIVFGKPSTQQKEIYETVLQAQTAAIDVCKPGEAIGNIDKAAREIIEQAGYGEYFTHRVGHGLGIDVHEYPSMNSTNVMQLQAGMVFTIEPGIYVPAIGGVRIEDDVLVTTDGAELLTKFPKNLQCI